MHSSKKNCPKIGFPAPLLGEENLRLPVLYRGEGLLALNCPAGVLINQHSWYDDKPILVEALNRQLEAGKPELIDLGLDPQRRVNSVFSTDPQVAGVALLCDTHEATETYRNQYGSSLMSLVFTFVATGSAPDEVVECDLPLAQHATRNRSIVSHTTGKKSFTRFRQVERIGAYSIWEAETNYYRPEQLFLHAVEIGLSMLGDMKYASQRPLRLSEIKRGWRGDYDEEKPIYEWPAACLTEVRLPDETKIQAELPARMETLIKQLKRFA